MRDHCQHNNQRGSEKYGRTMSRIDYAVAPPLDLLHSPLMATRALPLHPYRPYHRLDHLRSHLSAALLVVVTVVAPQAEEVLPSHHRQ